MTIVNPDPAFWESFEPPVAAVQDELLWDEAKTDDDPAWGEGDGDTEASRGEIVLPIQAASPSPDVEDEDERTDAQKMADELDAEQALDPGGAGQLNFVDEIEEAQPEETARELTHEWIGLPAFGAAKQPARVVISFEGEDDRQEFFEVVGIKTVHKGTRGTLSVWWPDKPKEDLSSLRFVVESVSGMERER